MVDCCHPGLVCHFACGRLKGVPSPLDPPPEGLTPWNPRQRPDQYLVKEVGLGLIRAGRPGETEGPSPPPYLSVKECVGALCNGGAPFAGEFEWLRLIWK